MSDPAITPEGGDLSQALGKTDFTFVDWKGRPHTVVPLDFTDLSELEKRFGKVHLSMKDPGLDEAIFILWLSLRKDGLTEDEIDTCQQTRKWKLSPEAVGRMFRMNESAKLLEVTKQLYVMSGFDKEEVGKALEAAAKAEVEKMQKQAAEATPTPPMLANAPAAKS